LKEANTKSMQPAPNGEAGFTLLETAVAMVLLAIAGLGIASVFFFAAKNNTSARDRELAMAVAQQTMEQLRNAPFNDATLSATSGSSLTLTRAGRRYTVQTTVVDSNVVNGNATTKTITVRVTPWSDGTTWSRNVSSVFGSVTMVSDRSAQTVGPNRQL
jgi:prepilin-type N-terminal cleavage/methylation domain-containing protein